MTPYVELVSGLSLTSHPASNARQNASAPPHASNIDLNILGTYSIVYGGSPPDIPRKRVALIIAPPTSVRFEPLSILL
jgi:hypothetical protein